ncbi:MAG: DUF4957 domain-containing protein [Paludibacteraceae bacterium]|nr:DUF4957 domain-containing protein [Paludibacteraceae bacterium]
MKKIFLLIPLLAFAMIANAATTTISGGKNTLRNALNAASPNDVIILNAGTYTDDNYIEFTKNVEVKAADNATTKPIIQVTTYIKISSGAKVKISGIKLDGSQQGSRDQVIRAYEGANSLVMEDCEITAGKKPMFRVENGKNLDELTLKNCTVYSNTDKIVSNEAGGTIGALKIEGSDFYTNSKSVVSNSGTITTINFDGCDFTTNSETVIYSSSSAHVGSCTVNNSYFHDFAQCAININETTSSELKVKNSTFANIDARAFQAGMIESKTADGVYVVDHCTFYNCQIYSTDYGTVKVNSPSAKVSNCIFAMPVSTGSLRTVYVPDGLAAGTSVTNCMMHNYTKDDNIGIPSRSGLTKAYCLVANPNFEDAENGDFSLVGNDWTTMTLSPACGAATDGLDLGDPRWHSNGTLPETGFATAYTCSGQYAQIHGNIWKDANNYLYGDGGNKYGKGSNSAYGLATWRIHATAATAIKVTLDMDPDAAKSGHIFKVEIFDEKGVKMGEVEESGYSDSNTSTPLNGCIYLPKAGNYSIRLSNSQTYSSAKIKGVILAHEGGAVQAIPKTLDVSEAWYSAKGSRADNKISFTSYSDSWVKWNIATTGSHVKAYAVTLTIDNPTKYGHNFSVSVYEEGDEDHAQTVSEHAWNETFDADAPLALPLGLVALEGGKNYVVKVTNAESGAQPKIVSVGFAHAGGAVQTIPGTFAINEAWYGNGGTRENGTITFSSWSSDNSWIKWNAATTDDVFCNVTLRINTTNDHHFAVNIYEEGNEVAFATLSEKYSETTGDALDIDLGRVHIAADKNLLVKVTNPVSGSAAKVVSLKFEEVVIPTIELPNTLLPAAAMLSERAWVDTESAVDSLLFTARGDEGYNSSQWAKWKIHAATRGYYKFTLNAYTGTPTKAQQYILSVLSNDESEVIATKTTAWDNENNEYTDFVCAELLPGNYIVKVQNPEWGSRGRVLSIVPSYDGGAFTEIPTDPLLGTEAMMHPTKMTRDANNDIQYGDNGNPLDEFVMWNIHVTDPDEMEVTFNVLSGGHQFSLELYKAGVLVGSAAEPTANWDASVKLSDHLTFPEAGDYQLKLINNQENSVGLLHSITFTPYVAPEPVIIDETATTIEAWETYVNGNPIDLSIKRTLKGGVYNTICLPFVIGSTNSMNAAFGTGYELLRLKEATLENGVLNLIFEPKTTMESGVPYLIKPVNDVIDPSFTGRTIDKTAAYTETKGDVQFIGTFVKQTIDQDEHNLYLGNDNSLYFVNNDVTIKGMRGYFHLNIQNPQQVIRRANIVAGGQVITSIDLIKDTNNGFLKTIEDGQIVIIREGVRYNVMGVKLQ